MAHASSASRPPLKSNDTLDATTLAGTLGGNGVATLRADNATSSNGLPSPPAEAQTFDGIRHSSEADTVYLSDDQIENYDELEIDPDTLVANTRSSMHSAYRPARSDMNGKGVSEEGDTSSSAARPAHKKRGSLQIRLERTDKKGRYVLTADDPETKEILRRGMEREQEAASGRPSKGRTRLRDMIFTRQFTTFDRQNPASAESPFFGFFTLFWICMVFIFVNSALKNYRDFGSILGENQVMRLMLSRDLLVLGLTDGVMFLLTLEGYFFQLMIRRGWINWAKNGWIIQNIWQSVYLAAIVGWTYYRDWPWTHTVFITLHALVFVMKMHSYAFYNGYLSGVYKRKQLLERKLKQLESLEPISSPPTSPLNPHKTFDAPLSTSVEISELAKRDEEATLNKRRPSMGHRTSTNLHTEKSDVAAVAAAVESGRPIDADQMQIFSSVIKHEIADLANELQGKSESGKHTYPKNLTLYNNAEFICLPTLVYELEYPRQEKINWWYVAEKTTATFGVLCVMQVISQAFIYPLVAKTYAMKRAGLPLEARWREFPFIVCDMLFPLLIEQLLTWYLIWECILNVLAELTCFADRGFYGDWWNSVTWDQYARDWNRPVHNFLLRHVYFSSISTFHLSRHAATFVTFLLSALVHEMIMALMFRKLRGYLFCLQLMQMPLVAFSRSKLMKGRVVLGNTVFWLGLFIGPSVLTCLYLVV